MDVQKKLEEIVATVQNARSMPMSASCVVNRADLLDLLAQVRDALPNSLAQAQELIGGREQMVEQARQEAERIIEAAHAERGTIVSDTQIARQSQEEADRILSEARREAEEIRAEADEYVDSKLANFEVVLNKTIGSVDRGREKLLGRGPGLDENGYPEQDAPEYSADPQTLIQRADAYVDAKLGAFEAVLSKTLEAVGRGRQKLHGRIATDALGEHMAAQDGLGHAVHTSDADYLAGLAELADPEPAAAPPAAPAPAPGAAQIPAQQDPYGYPQPPQTDPYAYQQQDPYAYQQPPQADPYAYQQQDPYAYQQQPQVQPQAAALDETSFFDTSMIDLEQLRRYEQGQ
ncbi:cell division initiation protein [Streptomyces filamentosus]|uniref:cell division initiation protein n=1 Tax=Streptomyces filamentosus TaxID=67294 RepID=UPI0036ED26D6